jgi:alpha-galactosidase
MSILFDQEHNVFSLETPDSSYIIAVADGFIGHAYYGKKISGSDAGYLLRTNEPPFVPSGNNRERISFYDTFPCEYPCGGTGDFRESALDVRTLKGHNAVCLRYVGYKITEGAAKLEELPAVTGAPSDCSTLELLCRDDVTGLEVTLLYTVYEDCNAIARAVRITNNGNEPLYLTKALSAAFDMDNRSFDLLTLHGSWARERHINRRQVTSGKQGVCSTRGESGHQQNPFMAVCARNADEDSGEVYGFSFVYSGNFTADAQVDQFNSIRLLMGINPDGFCWKLTSGDTFTCPQVVLAWSSEGLNGMSHVYHDMYRNHLIRGEYRDKMRPILINNWEATYFDFDTDKLISIAEEAAKDGIEMLVMDDGWFGKRSSDNCSLGDWNVNEEKIKGGLNHLVTEVNKLGMKFGLWFEPEMVSPDSDLYRAHPDWAIAIPDRTAGLSRNQYVLDLSRPEVAEHAYNSVATVLHSANIAYVKWDMNRPLADIGSASLPADRQGELFHRYVLAVYRMQERLITEFPHLLLENCSGGGARFDPGMLYYSPQIWCSDDTDAIERLSIQEGTALVYPLSSMGAHVSTCPNHACGRVTPFKTRGYAALSGTFGYELDITKIPQEDRALIPGQVALYKKFNALIRTGDYYRIASYSQNNEWDCWESVSKDKTQAIVTLIQVLNHPNYHSRKIYFKGLDPDTKYKVSFPDDEAEKREMPGSFTGSMLMNAGFTLPRMWGDFQGKLIYIQEG